LTVYADSSVFVSLYLPDVHSATARGWTTGSTRLWFSPLHAAEFFHAVAQQVFCRKISHANADKVFDDLRRDRLAGLWLETAVPDNALEVCGDLGRRYGPKLGVRTLDSLHVACALELKTQRFLTFDDRQRKLAKAAGLDLRKA
jgi:predicted nucleic acid-binding protein